MSKVGIIGLGHMGKRYAKMITSNQVDSLELVCVCTRSEMSESWLDENCGGIVSSGKVKIFKSEDEMYEQFGDEFDSIIITTPHRLHPDTAIKGIRKGKNVLCEKPAGIDVISARQMYSESKFAGVVYELIFHQRSYERFRKLKGFIDSGKIGKIKCVRQVDTGFYRTRYYHSSGQWRSSWHGEGGGALINQGQHLLDMWQWLFGMPKEMMATVSLGKYNDFIVDDEAMLQFSYENGMTGSFFISTGEVHKERYMEISGTKGHIRVEDGKIGLYTYSRDQEEYSKMAKCQSTQEISEEYTEFLFDEEGGDAPYVEILENFGRACNGEDVETLTNGSDGIKTLELTCGAYLSAYKGKKIELPVNGEEYRDFLDEMKHIESEM